MLEPGATNDDTRWPICIACWINKSTLALHTRTRIRIPPRTHAHTHTHRQMCNIDFFSTATKIHEPASQYYVICTLPALFIIPPILHNYCHHMASPDHAAHHIIGLDVYWNYQSFSASFITHQSYVFHRLIYVGSD
jgi:hypothetical protein